MLHEIIQSKKKKKPKIKKKPHITMLLSILNHHEEGPGTVLVHLN